LFSTEELKSQNNTIYTIDYYEPSYNGKYVVFGLSFNGNENSVLHIIDVGSQKLLDEKTDMAVAANPQWLPGDKGFFYKQHKFLKEKRFEDTRIKLHYLGTDPEKDKEVFSRKVTKSIAIDKNDFPRIFVFPGSEYVLGTINSGATSYSAIYFAKLDQVLNSPPGKIQWSQLCTGEDKVSKYCLHGNDLYRVSYSKNPNGRFERINVSNPKEIDILFEGKDIVISNLIRTENSIYISYAGNGIDNILEFKNFTGEKNNVALPFEGSVTLRPFFTINSFYSHGKNLIFGLESWNREWGVYCYNTDNNEVTRINSRPAGPYGMLSDLIVKEVEVPSYDGEKIPLSIIHKKNIKLNGKNPTIIYGYGAYGSSIDPEFDVSRLIWFNKGGIYAIAHVRGGGEKGENWRLGGYKATKPNSWKDFIACAGYLIKEKYTSSEKLAAYGVSAGGITVGRSIMEKPGLFQAAIIQVGSLNTLRHEFSNNTGSATEFGSVKDSLEFQYLYEMDTYSHIKDKVKYPALLLTTGLNDQRVAPWEPGKVTARIQMNNQANNIILLRVGKEGHAGSSDIVSETTDIYSFLLWQLGEPGYRY
jgi:prolyl oligopeptidase